MFRLMILVTGAAAPTLALAPCGGSSKSKVAGARRGALPPFVEHSGHHLGTGGGREHAHTGSESSGRLLSSSHLVKPSLSADASNVAIQFANGSSLPHNLRIQHGTSGAVVGATPAFSGGGTKAPTVTLKPGRVHLLPQHRRRAAGIRGALMGS